MSDRAVVILRVLVGLAVFLAVPAVAQAATVANTNDGGPGSLRDAVATTPSGGTVDFAPGLTGTITLSTGALVINQAVTISGPGASSVTVNASLQSDRVFDIQAADTDNVTISGLTISGGSFAGNGAGIFANIVGTLTLSGDTITGNHVSVANPTAATGGGGVYVNGGRLEVDNCTITQNSVTLTGSGSSGSGGGGVYSNGGSIIMRVILSSDSNADACATGDFRRRGAGPRVF